MTKMYLISILLTSLIGIGCTALPEGAFEAESFSSFIEKNMENKSDKTKDSQSILVKDENPEESSSSIKDDVYNVALAYTKEKTTYRTGATGKPENHFDCSGFVIRCYEDATRDTDYTLPFTYSRSGHPSSRVLYNSYSEKTTKPKRGDLLFIDYARKGTVNHVCIYDGCENGKIYFIDASDYYKKAVDRRSIKANDSRIIGYGVMKLSKK